MNISTLTAGLNILSAELKSPPVFDETKIELWLRVLERENVTDDEFISLCYAAVTTLTFFPTIGELLKSRAAHQDERIENAWVTALELVKQVGSFGSLDLSDVEGDGAILWTLNRLDWDEWAPSITAENLSIRRAEFVRIYKLAVQAGYFADHVAGQCEKNNRGKGLDLDDYAAFGRLYPFGRRKALPGARKKRLEET